MLGVPEGRVDLTTGSKYWAEILLIKNIPCGKYLNASLSAQAENLLGGFNKQRDNV